MDQILAKIRSKRSKSYTTKADIKRIQEAQASGDWSAVHASRLYRLHSGEYCELLQYVGEGSK